MKGVVVILHSIGVHSGLCAHLADRLSKEGYTAVSFDYRGHGQSEGERAFIEDKNLYLGDIDRFLEMVVKLYSSAPLFIFGWGAGTLFGLNVAKKFKNKYKIAGLLACQPMVKKPEIGAMAKVFSSIGMALMPNKMGVFKPDPAMMLKNKEATNFISKD